MWDIWDIYYDRLKSQQQIILDGLVVMISACHLCKIKRGRPGFDSLSGRSSFFFGSQEWAFSFFRRDCGWVGFGLIILFSRAPFTNIAAAAHSNLAIGGLMICIGNVTSYRRSHPQQSSTTYHNNLVASVAAILNSPSPVSQRRLLN
jgi:hypothetical protein